MMKALTLTATITVLMTVCAYAQEEMPADTKHDEISTVQLPTPRTDGGMPLLQTLKERRSSRDFSTTPLPAQMLSDLLWAACGINRPADGLLTAPTARNMQEILVYVATVDGIYLYDAKANALEPVVAGDHREATGGQPFVKDAPVNLIYVADYSKMGNTPEDQKVFYSATDTGFVSQNVYLFCASEGLSTVVRGWLDKDALAKTMQLGPEKKVVLAQTVGFPAEPEPTPEDK